MPDLYSDLYTTSFVEQGLVVSAGTGLSVNVGIGVALIKDSPNGPRQMLASPATIPVSASSTLYLNWSGREFATTKTDVVPSGFIRLAIVTTNASAVTNITDSRSLTNPANVTGGASPATNTTTGLVQTDVAQSGTPTALTVQNYPNGAAKLNVSSKLPLTTIDSGSASLNQLMSWNGGAWVPVTPTGSTPFMTDQVFDGYNQALASGADTVTTTFNVDGTITEAFTVSGLSITTTFNSNGTISQAYTGPFTRSKVTTFNSNGTISEAVS